MKANLVKLGELYKITSGGTPSKSNKDYYNGNIPWIKTGDLKSMYLDKSSEYITDLGLQKSSAKLFPKGTVLVAMYGATIGNCSILEIDASTNQACAAFKPNKDILPEFLYYYLLSIKGKLISLGVGGAQPNISISILKNIDIPLISLEEQTKIVSILNKSQGLIIKRKSQIEVLEQLTRSLFLDMFGNPVTNSKNWVTKKVSDAAPVQQYKGDLGDTGIWLLNLDKVKPKTGKIIEYMYVDKESVGSSTSIFNEENVLYSKLRPYLNKVVLPDRKGIATSELIPLRPDKRVLNRFFLAHLLRSDFFVSYISTKVVGAKMPRVSMNTFKNFELIIPPLHLQNDFASKVEEIEKQKSLMQSSIVELENIYNALMQTAFKENLITGKKASNL